MADQSVAIVEAAEQVIAAGGGLARLTDVIENLESYDVGSVRAALLLAMAYELDLREHMAEVVDVLASVFGTLACGSDAAANADPE